MSIRERLNVSSPALGPTAHVDTFTRDHLPPSDQWPDLLLDRPEFQYPEHLNVAVELTDSFNVDAASCRVFFPRM